MAYNIVIAGIALVMALDSLYDLFDVYTAKEVLLEMLIFFFWVAVLLWSVSECLV